MCQCLACQMGLVDACMEKTSSESNQVFPIIESDPSLTDRLEDLENEDDVRGSLRRSGGSGNRSKQRNNNLKDQQSTGRKRAAKEYPFIPAKDEGTCEWQNRSNCGGGAFPIRGCLSGVQNARHHGPDKSVVNNEKGNVHRICHYCHNRWHVLNDPGYDWANPCTTPHSPRPMTEAEIEDALLDELDKANRKIRRVKD